LFALFSMESTVFGAMSNRPPKRIAMLPIQRIYIIYLPLFYSE